MPDIKIVNNMLFILSLSILLSGEFSKTNYKYNLKENKLLISSKEQISSLIITSIKELPPLVDIEFV